MLKNPVTSISVVTLLNNMLFTGVMFILPQYAHMIGISSVVTATVISACGAVNIILSIALPRLQKLIVNRFILVVASAIFAVITILSIIFIREKIAFLSLLALMVVSLSVVTIILFPLTMMSVPPQFIA